MKKQTDCDGSIRELLNTSNRQIGDLKSCAQKASPGLRKKCEHLISVLIANRETFKRGLMVGEEGEFRSSRRAA